VLIVGAGALGLTCAHHLQLAGAEISFLVRPHRLEDLSRPQQLYCYNDHSLKTLEGYSVLTEAELSRGQQFDFVLLTLDGATCRSEQGSATLSALGQALADSDAGLVVSAVGIGLYEFIQARTGLSREQILPGTMRMFAYQVDQADMPLPPPTDIALHNSADVAYLSFPDRVGFFISARPKKLSRAFSSLWDACGMLTCKRMPDKIYTIFSNSFFPFTTACEVNGWQGTDALIADGELWHLCCEAQREIMRLRQHGLTGKLFALLMSDARLEKMMRDMAREGSPIGFTAFNRFHHGGKVLEQDIQIMENCAAVGQQNGQAMSAVNTLLSRWREGRQRAQHSQQEQAGTVS